MRESTGRTRAAPSDISDREFRRTFWISWACTIVGGGSMLAAITFLAWKVMGGGS